MNCNYEWKLWIVAKNRLGLYESEIDFGICLCFLNISKEFLLLLGSHKKMSPFLGDGTEPNKYNKNDPKIKK